MNKHRVLYTSVENSFQVLVNFCAFSLGFSEHSRRKGCDIGGFKWETYRVICCREEILVTSIRMITDNSALLSEVSSFVVNSAVLVLWNWEIFRHSLSEHSLQIWNSTGIWMKTAIHNWRHTKLSAFLNLTVPHLTATHDHT